MQFGKDRDFAINELVTALNAAAGAGTWAFVPSPAAADLPPLSEQDVIRNGYIYKPATVALVGGSVVLADESTGTEAFADAREPLAQAFKAVGTPDADAFAVIVNHFKSKGSGTPGPPTGQGNANDRRELQAAALVELRRRASRRCVASPASSSPVTSTPTRTRTRSRSSSGAGYTNLESTFDPEEESYNFDGQVGSLDHVLANAAAAGRHRGRRHLADQLLRVGLLRVQPVQPERHEPLPAQPVPVLRPQPGDHRHQRRRHPGRAGDPEHPDPGYERLPRSDRERGDVGHGGCRSAGRCGEPAAYGEPRHGVRGGR